VVKPKEEKKKQLKRQNTTEGGVQTKAQLQRKIVDLEQNQKKDAQKLESVKQENEQFRR